MAEVTVWPSHCRMPPGVLLDRVLRRLADHPELSRVRELLTENRCAPNHTLYDGDRCIGLAEFILDRVPEQGLIVESGCFAGVSTEVFALLRPRCEIISIDRYPQDKARERLRRYDNVRLISADTHEVASRFHRTIDTLYVDSEHTKFHIVRELLGWLPHVRPGGIAAGHDYLRDWPDVIEAIYEVFWEPPHYVYGDGTWAYVMTTESARRSDVVGRPVAGEDSQGEPARPGPVGDLATAGAPADEVAGARDPLSRHVTEVASLGSALEHAQAALVASEREHARDKEALARREVELRCLTEELNDAQARISYMLESVSWKLTAPLRTVRRRLAPSDGTNGATSR